MRTNPTDNFKKNIKQELLCPISEQLMKNPVIAADGYTYEKEHIEKWFTEKGVQAKSPITGLVFAHCGLLPDHTLKKFLDAYTTDQVGLEQLTGLQDTGLSQRFLQVASGAQQTEILRTERAGLILTRGRLRQLTHRAVDSSCLIEKNADLAHCRAVLQKNFEDQKANAVLIYAKEIEDAEKTFQLELNDIKIKIRDANERENDEEVRKLIGKRQEKRKQYEQSRAMRVSQHENQLKRMEVEYQGNDAKLNMEQDHVGTAQAIKIRLLENFARRLECLDKAIDLHTQLVREGYQECQDQGRGVLHYLEQRAAFFVPRVVTNATSEKLTVGGPVDPPIDPQEIQAFLTAVYRGELDRVEALLKTIPTLVYAEGDLTDLSKRHFTCITGFQYAVWALDGPMQEVILRYLPPEGAATQLRAYTVRQDLIVAHGLRYSFDNLFKEYDAFLRNWRKWSWDQSTEHWVQKIGAEQAKMPAWLVYAFTEPGENVAWVKMERDQRGLRILSEDFKEFQRVIAQGYTWVRGGQGLTRVNVIRGEYAFLMARYVCFIEEFVQHDLSMIKSFQARSATQYHTLINQLNSQLIKCDIPPSGPQQ